MWRVVGDGNKAGCSFVVAKSREVFLLLQSNSLVEFSCNKTENWITGNTLIGLHSFPTKLIVLISYIACSVYCTSPSCTVKKPNSPWRGINNYSPESLFSDIPAGDGNIANLFLQCGLLIFLFFMALICDPLISGLDINSICPPDLTLSDSWQL